MPLGLWKSKWEIHREDAERYREEADARDAKHREEAKERDATRSEEAKEHRERMERFSEEMREERKASEGRRLRLGEKYDRELAETRRFNREMLTRLDETYANLTATMQLVVDELHEVKLTVRAQTEAILKLVDRFEDPGGRPPV
jgi:hypothetical protein